MSLEMIEAHINLELAYINGLKERLNTSYNQLIELSAIKHLVLAGMDEPKAREVVRSLDGKIEIE